MRTEPRAEVAKEMPILEIRGSVEADDLAAGEGHDPLVADPVDFRIAEVPLLRIGKDGVSFVFVEGVSAVRRPGDALALALSGRGIDRYDRILAEAGGVVMVHDGAAGKDGAQLVRRDDGRPVFPVDQVFGYAQAPVHVAVGGAIRIVLEGKMPFAAGVDHAVRIVGPAEGRRKMHERPVGLVRIVAPVIRRPDGTENCIRLLDAGQLDRHVLPFVRFDVDRDVIFDVLRSRTGALGVSQDVDAVHFYGEAGVDAGIGGRDEDVFLVCLEGHGVLVVVGAEPLGPLLDLIDQQVSAGYPAGSENACGRSLDPDDGFFPGHVPHIPGHPFQDGRVVADGRCRADRLTVYQQLDGSPGSAETGGLGTAQQHVDIMSGQDERFAGQGSGQGVVLRAPEVGGTHVTADSGVLGGDGEGFSFRGPAVQAMFEIFDDDAVPAGAQEGGEQETAKE